MATLQLILLNYYYSTDPHTQSRHWRESDGVFLACALLPPLYPSLPLSRSLAGSLKDTHTHTHTHIHTYTCTWLRWEDVRGVPKNSVAVGRQALVLKIRIQTKMKVLLQYQGAALQTSMQYQGASLRVCVCVCVCLSTVRLSLFSHLYVYQKVHAWTQTHAQRKKRPQTQKEFWRSKPNVTKILRAPMQRKTKINTHTKRKTTSKMKTLHTNAWMLGPGDNRKCKRTKT